MTLKNYIVMPNGKSKLLESLVFENTIFLLIGDTNIEQYIPDGCTFAKYDNFEQANDDFKWDSIMSMSEYLSDFDRVIFYSNEPKNQNLKYIENILRFINEDKCIFMFKSEM